MTITFIYDSFRKEKVLNNHKGEEYYFVLYFMFNFLESHFLVWFLKLQ